MDKKKSEITPSIDIFENEMLKQADLGLNYKTKGDTNFNVGVEKTILKDSDNKVPKKISAGVSKDTEDLSYGVEGYKQGKDRGAKASFTIRFNTGGEVELGKGKDYIKDLL